MEGESAISKPYHSSKSQRRAVCCNPFPAADPAATDTNRDINLHTWDSSGTSQEWWAHFTCASQDVFMVASLSPPQERGAAPVIKTGHVPFSSRENNQHSAAHIRHPQKHIGLVLITHWECQYVAGA